jgi:hypothetical protein
MGGKIRKHSDGRKERVHILVKIFRNTHLNRMCSVDHDGRRDIFENKSL